MCSRVHVTQAIYIVGFFLILYDSVFDAHFPFAAACSMGRLELPHMVSVDPCLLWTRASETTFGWLRDGSRKLYKFGRAILLTG